MKGVDKVMNVIEKKKKVMTCFIEATEDLMKEDDIDKISIRKIAKRAGYNSATLYYYFEDLEHLILFASIRYLREYTSALARNIKKGMTTIEKYRTVYETFNHYAFRSPVIFHNMFFGKYSPMLLEVIKEYYDIFPDDLEDHDELLRGLLTQGNMYSRDKQIVDQLVSEGTIEDKKSDITLKIIISVHESYVYEAMIQGDKLDLDSHEKSFLEIFDYLLDNAK
ncbi:TetR/AcrR family transcriptional regulator [Peptoniphilus harei]|uniref:TetR/AcrR family transcriptional regulator n=1 Tax=Peptoniphilus harei TaxID=54005 RepID=UPI00290250B2|nr:TetR/AcrR family transcriptional regulator [Peptoniphilus harei]MDU1642104.1 TetR/AcrR family transcriptional regulator [Peptoniphilus harei]